MPNADLIKQNEAALDFQRPVAPQIDIVSILRSAIDSGRPMSEYKEALDLAERVEAIRRESLFNEAFAAFKRDCPPIVRRTQDEYITVTRNGVRRPRMYASLDDISATCDPHLHKHGLTYDWLDSELTADGCIVRKFVLRHVAGHSRAPVASPPIPIEGGEAYKKLDPNRKATSASPQQRMGVADTYAKRYSMSAGLGIPTCDEDDEPFHGEETKPTGPTLSADQIETVNNLLIELADARKIPHEDQIATFKAGFKVKTLAEIKAADFGRAVDSIKAKMGAKK